MPILKAACISIPQYINNIEQVKLIHSIYYQHDTVYYHHIAQS